MRDAHLRQERMDAICHACESLPKLQEGYYPVDASRQLDAANRRFLTTLQLQYPERFAA